MHVHVHAHVMITGVPYMYTSIYTGEGAFFTAAMFVLVTVFVVAKTTDDLTQGATSRAIHVH